MTTPSFPSPLDASPPKGDDRELRNVTHRTPATPNVNDVGAGARNLQDGYVFRVLSTSVWLATCIKPGCIHKEFVYALRVVKTGSLYRFVSVALCLDTS